MVSELGSQVENVATTNDIQDNTENAPLVADIAQIDTPAGESISASEPSEDPGLIMSSNGDLIVGDRFWSIFCDEVERIFESVRGPVPSEWEANLHANLDAPSHEPSHISYYRFLLRQSDAAAKYDLLHPSPPQLLFLWQTFVDEIDPFIKLLHVPSMTRLIREMRGHYSSVGSGTEALVFAVSFATISILSEEDARLNFGTSKEELVVRYQLGTEQSLEKAGILKTSDLAAVQALTVYINTLLSNKERDPAWALVGVLIRIAVRLQIHKDGSHFPELTAFDLEMRRRLWWQICLVDSRAGAAKVSKFLITEDMFDAKLPSNIDDADINPKATSLPDSCERRTDMTISLVRIVIQQYTIHKITNHQHRSTMSEMGKTLGSSQGQESLCS
ncbi:hypothetical protein Dda_7340 [Drechslerella dactyloides]|uniref:Xylanolytic transcriptional activator regulatory domain-containing protein n=1 Tax=Drechslerella dactyloides TaxID=74499 RepID=A0AAD6IS19_DREDA|nr:hypothetical protein Dda_7340 [Drechslerella dactyloides]